MSKREFRYISSEVRVATEDGQPKRLMGLIPYNQRSVDLGGFVEMVSPGAFASSINGDVLALRDHDPKMLLGRTKSGTLMFSDEADGLHYVITLPNTTQANDLAESVSRGDLDATSFGFYCKKDAWSEGNTLRTLLDVELFEVSPCSFAAYPSTSVSLRCFPDGGIEPPVQATRSTACDCDCPECKDGDCADCSCPECDCNGCECDEYRNTKLRLEIAKRV